MTDDRLPLSELLQKSDARTLNASNGVIAAAELFEDVPAAVLVTAS